MIQKILFPTLLISFLFCIVQNSKAQDPIQYGVPYDTVFLKNETKLIYSATEKSRIIRIINPTVDTILRITDTRSSSFLGKVKADYEDCFVLSDDEDAYENISIYKKENGKRLVFGQVVFFDTLSNAICYADWNKQDILYIFDFNRSVIEKYFTPSTNCLRFWYCIQVRAMNDTQFTIEYFAKNTNIKTKKTFTRAKTSP